MKVMGTLHSLGKQLLTQRSWTKETHSLEAERVWKKSIFKTGNHQKQRQVSKICVRRARHFSKMGPHNEQPSSRWYAESQMIKLGFKPPLPKVRWHPGMDKGWIIRWDSKCSRHEERKQTVFGNQAWSDKPCVEEPHIFLWHSWLLIYDIT